MSSPLERIKEQAAGSFGVAGHIAMQQYPTVPVNNEQNSKPNSIIDVAREKGLLS